MKYLDELPFNHLDAELALDTPIEDLQRELVELLEPDVFIGENIEIGDGRFNRFSIVLGKPIHLPTGKPLNDPAFEGVYVTSHTDVEGLAKKLLSIESLTVKPSDIVANIRRHKLAGVRYKWPNDPQQPTVAAGHSQKICKLG